MVPKLSFLTSVSMRMWGGYKVPSAPLADLTHSFHKVLLLFSSLTTRPPPTINFSAPREERITVFSLLIFPYVHPFFFFFVSLFMGNVNTHISYTCGDA